MQTPAYYDEVLGDFCPAGCTVEAKADATAPFKPRPIPRDPALEAWNATKATDSVDVLSAYIAKFGNSFYAELAKARLEELKRKQRLAAAAPAEPQASGPDPALAAWNAVKDSDNVDVLETFIGSYPLSFYAELARVHLKELKQKQLAALVVPLAPKISPPPPDPIVAMWNATKNTDNVSLLEAFAGKYPESFYAELAKARIDELKRKQRLASLEASEPQTPKTDPSLEAWNAAKASENVSVLQALVDNYPLSFYAEIAKARIEELKRKQLETAQQAMVQEIQRALKDIECYGGVVDGVWSGGSKEALDRFSQLAKLNPAPEEPGQATLDFLKAWKGDHCPAAKVATPRPSDKIAAPRKEKVSPALAPAKTTKSPRGKVAKNPGPNNNVNYDLPEKQQAAKKAGRTLEYDYGSVYCAQGCAGGFTGVLSGTATNPGMKR